MCRTPNPSARPVLRRAHVGCESRRLRLRREQRSPIVRRVPHVPYRPVRPRPVVEHGGLLRPNEVCVFRDTISRAVEVELEVLHP